MHESQRRRRGRGRGQGQGRGHACASGRPKGPSTGTPPLLDPTPSRPRVSAGLLPACWWRQGSLIGALTAARPLHMPSVSCCTSPLPCSHQGCGFRFLVCGGCRISDLSGQTLGNVLKGPLRSHEVYAASSRLFGSLGEGRVCSCGEWCQRRGLCLYWRERGARERCVSSWRERVAEEWLFCQGEKPGMRWTCAKPKTFPRLPCSYDNHVRVLVNDM